MAKKATRKKSSTATHAEDMQQRKLERVLLKKRIHAQREIVSLSKQLQRAVKQSDVALSDLASFLNQLAPYTVVEPRHEAPPSPAAHAHDDATEAVHAR